jgi:hypothetical protein
MLKPSLSPAAAMSQVPSAGRTITPDQIDDFGRALLLLARELWVAKDRQRVLEAVLEERGIDVTAAIRDYQPSGELAAELEAERSRFASAIVQTLCPECAS